MFAAAIVKIFLSYSYTMIFCCTACNVWIQFYRFNNVVLHGFRIAAAVNGIFITSFYTPLYGGLTTIMFRCIRLIAEGKKMFDECQTFSNIQSK